MLYLQILVDDASLCITQYIFGDIADHLDTQRQRTIES